MMEWWRLGLDALGAVGAVVAAIGVVHGFRQFRMQMNAQTFLTYTERYSKIMGALPLEFRLRRYDASAASSLSDPHIKDAYLQYFSMCSQEFYLWQEGYLQKRLWRVWEVEIKRTVSSPLGRAAWALIETEFHSFPAFHEWVTAAQQESARTLTV